MTVTTTRTAEFLDKEIVQLRVFLTVQLFATNTVRISTMKVILLVVLVACVGVVIYLLRIPVQTTPQFHVMMIAYRLARSQEMFIVVGGGIAYQLHCTVMVVSQTVEQVTMRRQDAHQLPLQPPHKLALALQLLLAVAQLL